MFDYDDRMTDTDLDDEAKPETRRARQRRELLVEITDEARRLLETGGTAAVSWRAIARAVGLSPASLYTYFDSLDELFTELLLQSYGRLAAAVEAAVGAFADAQPGDRLLVGPLAYRSWALANRGQFNLIFTDQLPGYVAKPGGPTVEAQVAIFRPMIAVLAEHPESDSGQSAVKMPDADREADVGFWAVFHGLTTLEVNHHLDWTDAPQIFETQVRWFIEQRGLPSASEGLVERFTDWSQNT